MGVGNRNIERIQTHFKSLKDFWLSSNDDINLMNNIKDNIKRKIIYNRSNNSIKDLLKNIERQNVKVVTIYDENYPDSLKYIDDNPKVLFLKGDIIDADNLAMAIVGSRKATSYGKWVCEKFTRELVELGVTIVSGLASGIDTVAHKTALSNGGRTIGVLGNGIDIVYPKKNLSLYNEMELKGGIITEFPMGTQPLAYNFPMRNRIISGLSLGVIVIEAQEKSGSLITAHLALEQGKDVFSVPGNINSIFSGGTNKLIKDGAKPLLDIDDVLEEIYQLKSKRTEKNEKAINYMDYSESELKIIRLLEEGPLHSDAIAYKLNMDISDVISILTILELKNIVNELSSRVFTIS